MESVLLSEDPSVAPGTREAPLCDRAVCCKPAFTLSVAHIVAYPLDSFIRWPPSQQQESSCSHAATAQSVLAPCCTAPSGLSDQVPLRLCAETHLLSSILYLLRSPLGMLAASWHLHNRYARSTASPFTLANKAFLHHHRPHTTPQAGSQTGAKRIHALGGYSENLLDIHALESSFAAAASAAAAHEPLTPLTKTATEGDNYHHVSLLKPSGAHGGTTVCKVLAIISSYINGVALTII